MMDNTLLNNNHNLLYHPQYHQLDKSYILLKINPIVNELLDCIKAPGTLSTSERVYDVLRDVRSQTSVQNGNELEILTILREHDYDRLTLHFKGGKMDLAKGEKQLKGTQEELRKIVENAIKKGEFEQVEFHKGESGNLTFLNKTKTIKPTLATGQVPAKKGKE